jgi:hypothetical protein
MRLVGKGHLQCLLSRNDAPDHLLVQVRPNIPETLYDGVMPLLFPSLIGRRSDRAVEEGISIMGGAILTAVVGLIMKAMANG